MVESSNLGSNHQSSAASGDSKPGNPRHPDSPCDTRDPDNRDNNDIQSTISSSPGDMTLEASISLRLRSINPRIDPNVSTLGSSAGILHAVYRVPYAGAMMLEGWLRESGTVARIMSCSSTPRQSRINGDGDAGAGTKLDKKHSKAHGETAPITAIASRDIIVLDIETLGLRDAAAIVIGFASFQNGDVVIDQFILADPASECAFFTRCIDFIRFQDPKMLVTFYGSKFDVPFLLDRSRFLETRAKGADGAGGAEAGPSQVRPIDKSEKADKVKESPKSISFYEDTASLFGKMRHVDLHALFKSQIPGLPKYNFQALERHILDVNERNDDIPGADVLPNYQAFLDAPTTNAKAHALALIIRHNFTDLVHSAFAFHAIVEKINKSLHDGSNPSLVPNPVENDTQRANSFPGRIEEADSTTDKPAPRDIPNKPIEPTDLVESNIAQDQGRATGTIEIPRAKPIVMLQGNKVNAVQNNLFSEQAMHDIACMFGDGMDIPTAQVILDKNNPGLHAMFERGGWFITLERLCMEGVLERREIGGKIMYKSNQTDPDFKYLADFGHSREMTYSNQPSNAEIENDPNLDKNQSTMVGNSNNDPGANTSETSGHPPVNSQAKSCPASRTFIIRSFKSFRTHVNSPTKPCLAPVLDSVDVPSPGLISNPKSIPANQDTISFKSVVFNIPRLQDIIRGWLATSGRLNIDDAAAALNVPRQDIMLYLFDQAGKGLINVKFKDDLFWVPIPAQAIPSESKANRKTK